MAGLGLLGASGRGWLSDRIGGARVTTAVFIATAVFTAAAIRGVQQRYGSTYKMIPSTFAVLGRRDAEETGSDPERWRWSTSGGRLR